MQVQLQIDTFPEDFYWTDGMACGNQSNRVAAVEVEVFGYLGDDSVAR